MPLEVCGVTLDGGYKRVALSDGREIVTRALMAATGMAYREHPAEGIQAFTGAGVYYGAATTEAPAFAGRKVLVIGGGNSAGQGAMYLSRYAAEVHIVIRRPTLAETMSAYLIEQIAKTTNITLRPCTELERVEGGGARRARDAALGHRVASRSSRKRMRCSCSSAPAPRSDWLPAGVLRDPKGFVLTGRELMADERFPRVWKEHRTAAAARNQHARHLRRGRRPRRRDEPRGRRRRRGLDGRALRARIPGDGLRWSLSVVVPGLLGSSQRQRETFVLPLRSPQ